jgi:hypothetical protein
MAVAAKVNCIRLVLAYAISIVLHFQLLDAAADTSGELDDVGVKQVLFLYCRLRKFLHDEEMEILDHSISVLRDAQPGFEARYRAEMCRFRLLNDPYCDHLVGLSEADRTSGGVTIVPAPKVIMSMLTQALLRPSDQPWGYQSRMYSILARTTLKLVNESMHLESIIMSPTPLPYLQHCRVLFALFSIMFPMSMDTDKGFFANVGLPLILFWAITGFEVLSGALENPLGNEDTDMNVLEKVHALECNVEHIFNCSECNKAPLHHALLKTESLVMGERYAGQPASVTSHQADSTKSFRSYFRWIPFPTTVLSDLMDSHGDVAQIHALRLSPKAFLPNFKLRTLLRKSLYRRKKLCGRTYEAVNTKGEESENEDDHPVDFNKDPNYFCHYLEFLGAADVAPALLEEHLGDGCSAPRQHGEAWRKRVLELLDDHSASLLLKKASEEDTERSIMMHTPRSNKESFLGGWENLS